MKLTEAQRRVLFELYGRKIPIPWTLVRASIATLRVLESQGLVKRCVIEEYRYFLITPAGCKALKEAKDG